MRTLIILPLLFAACAPDAVEPPAAPITCATTHSAVIDSTLYADGFKPPVDTGAFLFGNTLYLRAFVCTDTALCLVAANRTYRTVPLGRPIALVDHTGTCGEPHWTEPIGFDLTPLRTADDTVLLHLHGGQVLTYVY